MIRITKVEFENYRQYKSVSVSFHKQGNTDLHILRAKNGTGKTTFLNGILWCLYEKEHYLNDKDKALPVVNNGLIEQAKDNATLLVVVRITLNDDGNIIVFERTQPFFVVPNPFNNLKVVNNGTSKLKVIVTPSDNVSNSVVHEDEAEVQGFVKQYFDEAIYGYYFFDGENLKNYFTKGKSERIKESIFNIAQVTLLKNACSHTKSIADEKSRQSSKISDCNAASIIDEISAKENNIESLLKQNENINIELPKKRKIIDECDALLQGYAPIRLNMEKRAELEKKLKKTKSEYELFKSEKNSFIVTYMTLLRFYPRVKYALDLIQEKQETGTLPPSIDKEQVKALLNEHAKNCPICNGELDDKAINHLQSLLQELDVSSATSNYLMEIKGGLENAVNKCKNFPSEYKKIVDADKFYNDEIINTQNELDTISAFLSKYSHDGSSIDVKKIDADRKKATEEIISLETRKQLNDSDIARYKQELAERKEELKKIEENNKVKGHLAKEIAVLRKLSSNFEDVQTYITDKIRDDIQIHTWSIFNSMIWKKNTFSRITIDDNYLLTVYNKANYPMTGSLSATENMAVAYSFTLAIHDASGKNCPLVVDSPLGRVSDENRYNMANELLKVSENKQIIMLFTPAEYSDDVKSLYNEKAASIRDITLAEDEKEIKGVGNTNA